MSLLKNMWDNFSEYLNSDSAYDHSVLMEELKEATSKDTQEVLNALREVNADVSSENFFKVDCIKTGLILNRPLGEIIIDLLRLSEEKDDPLYEKLAVTLCGKFMMGFFENYYRFKTSRTDEVAPEIIAEIHPSKINQKGLSGRTFLMILLGAHPPFSRFSYHIFDYIERVIGKLLQNSADVTLPDKNGVTPLHLAVLTLNVKVCAMIIEHGASLTAADSTGSIPLHCMYKIRLRDKPRLEWLQKGDRNISASHDDASDEFLKICRLFRAKKYDFNTKDGAGDTLLHKAIGYDFQTSEFILRGAADANLETLKNGANVDETNIYGQTALHLACIANLSPYISSLNRYKASRSIEDLFGNRAFIYACASGACFAYEYDEIRIEGSLQNQAGWSPLHIAAYFDNDRAAVCLIHSMKSKEEHYHLINGTIKISGKTALMIACERGCTDFCHLLILDTYIEKNARDTIVGSALDWAFEFEQIEIATMLFEKDFDKDFTEEDKAKLAQRACQAEPIAQRRLLDILRNRWKKWGSILRIAQNKKYKETVEYVRMAQRKYSLDLSETS